MKKVLVVAYLNPPGGGSAVGAWALQALRGRFDVTVLTWDSVDLARVNRAFGTRLEAADFQWRCVAPAVGRVLALVPLPLSLLKMHLLHRTTRALHARHRFDAVIGLSNEMDIGETLIQYIHYPWGAFPRPEVDYRWYHFQPALLLYRALCRRISSFSMRRVTHNLTLVNSDWTGRIFQRWYGVLPRTVYPPVAGGFPDIPVAERAPAFVCLGRISPEKEIEKLIAIITRVRERGHEVALRIIGHADSHAYGRKIRKLAEPQRAWISIVDDLPRHDLMRVIAQHRYGIHGMVGEHFGVAPAELQRAGCLTFVPDEGGPAEIVGHDERLMYHSVDDAVDKIDRVLSDPGYEATIRRDMDRRKDLFSEERFMTELLDVVESFTNGSCGAAASRSG